MTAPALRTLRIQVASDLHLEHVERSFPGERLLAPAPDADLLVLAGDISNGTRAIDLFGDWPVPVVYVAGNHEFYEASWEQTRLDLRRAAQGTSVQFLDNDVADFRAFEDWYVSRAHVLARVRLFGTTLWTDYRDRCNRTRQQLMEGAELRIADHRLIHTQEGAFRAAQALQDHERSRAWLERELLRPFDGATVVVSHHAPHESSVHPRYVGDPVNAAFVSDLSDLLPHADVWLHGHVHDSFDYRLGRCRVLANPRGYVRNRRSATRVSELEYENPAFQWSCVVEVSV